MQGKTFHMVPKEYYENQPETENYQPEPMKQGRESFIHCTTGPENVVATAHRFYLNDPRPFYLLVVDMARVIAPVRYDAPGEVFPHIYGPLNRDAIVEIRDFKRDSKGNFLLPEPA